MSYQSAIQELRNLRKLLRELTDNTKVLLRALKSRDITDQTAQRLNRRTHNQLKTYLESQGYTVNYGPGGKPIVGMPSSGGASGGGMFVTPPPPPPGGNRPGSGRPPISQPAGGQFTPVEPQIDEIFTPQSSNVYSFAFYRRQGAKTGTLYVRFKAHEINRGAVGFGPGKLGGKRQLHGIVGRTVGQQTDKPGPLYAYYDVNAAIFNQFKSASSKGEFVWDALRVRGTIHGHQYRYQLVEGFEVENTGGQQYIPRKATAKGFKVRSVAEIGSGRRQFVSSTLPSQTGHYRSPSVRGGD